MGSCLVTDLSVKTKSISQSGFVSHNPEKAAFPIGQTELNALVRTLNDHLPVPIDTPKNAAHAIG
jgi:hypothetical protein